MFKFLLIDFRHLPLNKLVFVIPFFIVMVSVGKMVTHVDLLPSFTKYVFGESHSFLSPALFIDTVYQYPLFWAAIAFLIVYDICLDLLNLRLSRKKFGFVKSTSILASHFLINIIHAGLAFLFLFLCYELYYLFSGEYLSLAGINETVTAIYHDWIPTVIELPWAVAFVLTILLMDLQNYAFHRLVHESRFLWFVSHRYHHTPEVLHPLGAGPVFGFDFIFLKIPMLILSIVLSKLMYSDSLVLEISVFYFGWVMVEKFNHCSALYDMCRNNRVLFFLTSFYGCGSFHYTHHSAKPGEGMVNLGNDFFNFWDRVFGTYLKPSTTKPPIGLTNQPNIKLNPFVLLMSGWFTIFYELANNPAKDWFKIIFGSVYYTPENTKNYLRSTDEALDT